MKPTRFAYLFAVFISTMVAQSHPVTSVDQPFRWAFPQPPRSSMPSVFMQILPKIPVLQSGTGSPHTIEHTSDTLSAFGLNFASAVDYGSDGWGTYSVAKADVNGDGKLDLILANQCSTYDDNCNTSAGGNGSVTVLLGNGDGTFQEAVSYASGGGEADSVAVADVNGDGNIDLLVANGSGSVGILLGNGDGTFRAAVTYPSGGSNAVSVKVADVNGDGKPDLLVANTYSSVVGVLLGNGDGTFQPGVTYGSGGLYAFSVAVGDVNGDGKADLVVANECLAPCDGNVSGVVGVLLGNGNGTFQTAVTYNSGGFYAISVVLADVNGDGKLDVLVANVCAGTSQQCNEDEESSVGVLLGNGDGTFQTVVPYSSGGDQPISLAVSDVNGDGRLDLVVANACATNCAYSDGTVGVLLGNGDGSFQTSAAYDSGSYGGVGIAVADVNNDGKPDLLVANECQGSDCVTTGTVGVLVNTSIGSSTTSLTTSVNPSSFSQTVSLTSTVTPSQFFKFEPTGTVSFYDGPLNLGGSALNGIGVATLTNSTLSVGTHNVTATYNGDSNFGSSTSPVLSQVVQGAIAVLSPTTVNFGNQTVGIKSNQGVLINLTNTGNSALNISSIGITGANSADFSLNSNLCPSSLAAGFNCTMTVSFNPTATGTRNATLSVTDNAPGSPQTVSLSGVGVTPTVSLSPSSLTFSTQVVFTTSKTQTVTLTNTGLGVLSITNVSVTSPFSQTNTCGTAVSAGASCTFNVTFRPTKSGTVTGSVSITDNASGGPQKITLTGTGTDIQLSPTSFNFGNQPVGTKSLSKKITLSNKGSVSVSITSISLTGTNAKDFSQTNTCGTTVKSGASCSITVSFTPSVKGKRTANVSVNDSGGGSPQSVGLSGTGT